MPRAKEYQHLPLQLIGFDEVKSDLIFVEPLVNACGIEIDEKIAGLMLSAIISDTLLLKSPTTTDEDRKAVEELAKISGLDPEVYGLDMLKAGTDLSSFTIDEILHLDAKQIDFKEVTECS